MKQSSRKPEKGSVRAPLPMPERPGVPRKKAAIDNTDTRERTYEGIEASRNGWATSAGFRRTLEKVPIDGTGPLERGGVVLSSEGDSAWIDTKDNHTVILGSTGSQKSRRICMPTISMLARAGESMVVADCKGELYAETAGILEEQGYTVLNFNLRDPMCSNGWNPLAIPYRLYCSENKDDVAKGQNMVFDLAALLSPIVGNDPYWDQAGQDVIAGAIFLMFETAESEEEVNMGGIQSVVSMIPDTDSPLHGYMRSLSTDSVVYNCLAGPMFNAESTQRCILGMARKSIRPFVSHPVISSLLADNEIDPAMLAKGKMAVFMTVPDDRSTYNMLVTTFIKQAYSTLIDIADSKPGRRLKTNVTFLLDEYGSFPAIPDMASMITAARSRGMKFVLILQGLDQLKHRYGSEVANTILGNCANLVFINSREKDLLSYVSDMVGDDRNGRPLISRSKLQRLDKESGEMLVFHDREYPYISTLVDIEEYGLPEGHVSHEPMLHPQPTTFVFRRKRKTPGNRLTFDDIMRELEVMEEDD